MAGYHVTGVDIRKQPRYCGDRFVQDDAMVWLRGERESLTGFDLIWASPPCPFYSGATNSSGTRSNHPDLIPEVRSLLLASGRPYIIENVEGAPLVNPIMLCGTMFGLLTIRHRLFETCPIVWFPPGPCSHQRKTVTLGRRPDRNLHYAAVVGHFSDVEFAKTAMGIDWMVRDELKEAIPPAYSHYLATQMLAQKDTP